jgi:hypothetical protein
MYTIYEQVRFWLPLISGFGLVIKAYSSAKNNISEFCNKLLDNHLSHIEVATVSNAEEAKQTNILLKDHAGKIDMVQNTLRDHHEKQLQVWQGVIEGLTILKERTRASRTPKRKKNVR